MSYIRKLSVAVTTAADGSATAYSEVFTGRISQLRYVKTDFADGVDFAITVDGTGEGVWTESNVNASATRAPRQATHDVVGAASLYAAAGEPVEDKIAVAHDRIKIVIAQGGNAKAGTFHILVE
jgi:hypothetical protein